MKSGLTALARTMTTGYNTIFKVKVTVMAYIIQILLSVLYLLN